MKTTHFHLATKSRPVLAILLMALLEGCTLGMDYQRPQVQTPVQYKNDAPWKTATPGDALPKGSWWKLYGDAVLDDLQQQSVEANPGLQAAYARLSQVQAAAGITEAQRLPRLDLGAQAYRQRVAADLSGTGATVTGNSITLLPALSYEIDLWGRVKRSIEAARADVEGSEADYRALLLSLQAELARSYFDLRTLDAELSLVNQGIEARRKSLELIQIKYDNGQIGRLDLSRAQSELASTEAEALALLKRRAELENRIALLIGRPASGFSLPAASLALSVPAPAPGLPSSLLERRPDVAAAERRMAAAGARIGVAQTAFFPSISLSGTAGFGSHQLGDLFNWDNRTWGLGPTISLPIFDAGRNDANLDRARAAYEEAVANYRGQVLTAFAEVENGLSGLQWLHQQGQSLEQAVSSAKEALDLSEKRYRGGLVSYLEVLDSQRTALQAQRALTRLQGEQLGTSVLLIKALGGGWGVEGA